MAHNLLIVGFSDHCFNFAVSQDVQVGDLKQWLAKRQGSVGSFHLTLGGEPLRNSDVIPCGEDGGITLIKAHPILCGGKGGFGALIRAVGNRINRSNNNEACRDLSGRRLRDVNAEKKVSKWLEEEPERKKRLRDEKRKRRMRRRTQPKHFFDDQGYMKQLRANEEEMDDALKQGVGMEEEEEEADSTGSDADGESASEQEGGETSTDSEAPQTQTGSPNSSSGKSRRLDGEGVGMECVPGSSGLHPNSTTNTTDTTSTTGERHTAVVSVEVHVENSSIEQVVQPTLEQGGKMESLEASSTAGEEVGIEESESREEGPGGAGGREEGREEGPGGAGGREEGREEEPGGAVGREESREEEPGGAVGKEESREEPGGAGGREEGREEGPGGVVGREEGAEEEPGGAGGREESREEPGGAVGREEGTEEEPGGTVGREEGREECGVREREVTGEELPAESTVRPQSEELQANNDPIDLEEFGSVAELETVGGDRLKHVLQSMGLKCGGTVRERAERLFSTKGKALSELDPSLFAKAGKQKKRKRK